MKGSGIIPWAILSTLFLTKSIEATIWIWVGIVLFGVVLGFYLRNESEKDCANKKKQEKLIMEKDYLATINNAIAQVKKLKAEVEKVRD